LVSSEGARTVCDPSPVSSNLLSIAKYKQKPVSPIPVGTLSLADEAPRPQNPENCRLVHRGYPAAPLSYPGAFSGYDSGESKRLGQQPTWGRTGFFGRSPFFLQSFPFSYRFAARCIAERFSSL